MRSALVATSIAAAALVSGCSSSATGPTEIPVPEGTHRSAIAAVSGPGSGGVSVTPTAIPERTFAATISILIGNARPNATYIVQRAPEIGRALASDGVCQRALGQPPWSASDPAAAAFVTFANTAGAPITLTTAANGTGTANFEFRAPTIAAGTLFDVMFRLIDSETAATTELRSGCFTVIVK